MKTTFAILASATFAAGLALGTVAGPKAVSYVWRTQPMADPMEYGTFRDKAIAELATNADLISFTGDAPFLQEMRKEARTWSSLLRSLMADKTVSEEVKIGALPVIFDLPPAELVDFADHLNSLSLLDPGLFQVTLLAVQNPYRGSGFMKPGMIADTSVLDLEERSDAQAVLQRVARNPKMNPEMLSPGRSMAPYAPRK